MCSPVLLLLLALAADAPGAADQQQRNAAPRGATLGPPTAPAEATQPQEQENRYSAAIAETNRQVIELTAEIAEARQPSADLYAERADCWLFLGLPEKAIDDYSQALALEPLPGKRLSVFRNRIMARIRSGQYQRAIDEAESLCRVHPAPAEDLAIFALLLAKSPNRPKEDRIFSLKLAKEAQRAHRGGNVVGVLVERALASAYSVNGDFRSAIEHQKKALVAMGKDVFPSAREELAAYEAGREYPYSTKEVREAQLAK